MKITSYGTGNVVWAGDATLAIRASDCLQLVRFCHQESRNRTLRSRLIAQPFRLRSIAVFNKSLRDFQHCGRLFQGFYRSFS